VQCSCVDCVLDYSHCKREHNGMLTLKNIDKCYEECDEIQTYMRAQAYMQTQAIRFTKMYDVST
jgi:hypothetical protein